MALYSVWNDEASMSSLHCCQESLAPYEGYGEAITSCVEREDGTLWVGNGEYATQVNFCPFCGFGAKVKFVERKI